MRSASPKNPATAALLLLAAGGLGTIAGCTTTQQTAARLRVKNERILAARKPVVVKRADPQVKVLRSALVRGAGGAAIALELRNDGSEPVNDLPLSVGFRQGGKVTYLNRKIRSYFQGHAPALGPGERTTWVFTTDHAPKGGGAVVARVGAAARHTTVTGDLPRLEVLDPVAPRDGSVEARVTNDSSVTQYDLAVYATATRHGHVVAAGQGSVVKVDPGSTATVPLKLIGDPRGARVRVYAEPTIFE